MDTTTQPRKVQKLDCAVPVNAAILLAQLKRLVIEIQDHRVTGGTFEPFLKYFDRLRRGVSSVNSEAPKPDNFTRTIICVRGFTADVEIGNTSVRRNAMDQLAGTCSFPPDRFLTRRRIRIERKDMGSIR
jgi:hypothetical protein